MLFSPKYVMSYTKCTRRRYNGNKNNKYLLMCTWLVSRIAFIR